MTLKPRQEDTGLVGAIDKILEKGLVINADITVDVAGVQLLGIKIRAALASFETAAKYGLEFPSGTNTLTDAWRNALTDKEYCPQCGKSVDVEELLNMSCPWCGWLSARSNEIRKTKPVFNLNNWPISDEM